METKKVTLNLPKDTLFAAKTFCHRSGRTFSGLVRVAIEREITDLEGGSHV